jgi:hypothetical protein
MPLRFTAWTRPFLVYRTRIALSDQAEFLKVPLTRGGDSDDAAAAMALKPAPFEEATGKRRAQCTTKVIAPLAPVQTLASKRTPLLAYLLNVDVQFLE